jgi:hypothetical protein
MVFQGQDAWRRHPVISNCWRNPFPGIQKAAAIYAVYLAFDYTRRYVKYINSAPSATTKAQHH